MPEIRIRFRRLSLVVVLGVLAGALAWVDPAGAQELDPGAPPAGDVLAADEDGGAAAATLAETVSAQGVPAASVTGFGWGHGRGLGQYGALGYALDHGWTRDRILDHFYGNTVAGRVDGGWMSVRLMAQDGVPLTAAVGAGSRIGIDDHDNGNGVSWPLPPGTTGVRVTLTVGPFGTWWWVEPVAGCVGTPLGDGFAVSGPARVLVLDAAGTPVPPWPVDMPLERNLQVCSGPASSTTYRGELVAINDGGTQRTVNWVPTELYLRGVVPREMPVSWADLGSGVGAHALEAQAVAARSYALSENRWSYAKTCDSTSCQVYGGRATTTNGVREDARSDAAIDATTGLVRLRNGAVVRSEFSSSTGGYTAGGIFPIVQDLGDATSRNPNRTWSTSVTAASIEQRYAKAGLASVQVVERTGVGAEGGRVVRVRLTFADGTVVERTGNQFRADFGLKSDWFSVSYTPPSVGAPVMTGYTDSEWVDLTAAAAWLQVTPEEFQRVGAWVTAFLIGVSRNPNEVGWLNPPPTTAGPRQVTTVYFDEDLPSIRTVMRRWTLTPSQAQKVSATVLTFLAGVDRARQGG